MVREKGGWQCKVFLYKDYVIKKPLSYKEVRKKAYKWLKENQGKNEKEISKIAKECFDDIEKSRKLIESSGIPKKYLGNPVFYKDGRVKQKRVVELGVRIKNLVKNGRVKEAEEVIDKFFEFVKILWNYGLREKPFKINQNFGIINNRVILIDLFELNGDYKSAKRSLEKGINKSDKNLEWSITKKMIPDYQKKARETLNEKTLDKHWKSKNIHKNPKTTTFLNSFFL
ncbi:hypothetical protein COU61_03305 [Candidatus Pacearchaeota archaeon CG10_big_fil_rev_8_21_14_0_10_35_13]|nr:MAG: hypothetical protein COU61_03305 [Candidatus Pacearchaeota archaeon CG10_big_fil_rev_8_21_14_0_10_35_13]